MNLLTLHSVYDKLLLVTVQPRTHEGKGIRAYYKTVQKGQKI